MRLNKNDFITFISLIYRNEKLYKETIEAWIKNLERSNVLVKKINSLEVSEQNKELFVLKDNIIKNNENVKKNLEDIQSLKSGEETLYKWEFMNQESLESIKKSVRSTDLKEWLDLNFRNGQKIIYSELDVEVIIDLLQHDDKTNNALIEKYEKLLGKKFIFYVSSTLNLKGKETAYLYINLDSDNEVVLKCKSTDVISANLLNISEDVDLSILNNLKENNELSFLYDLAFREASLVNMKSEDEEVLIKLSNQLSKILGQNLE